MAIRSLSEHQQKLLRRYLRLARELAGYITRRDTARSSRALLKVILATSEDSSHFDATRDLPLLAALLHRQARNYERLSAIDGAIGWLAKSSDWARKAFLAAL